MRSTLAFTLALVAGLVGVTAIASAMTSSNPSTPPPTRGKATDTHPRLKKSFRVLRRERRADDALTADGEQMLEAASELGTNAKLARRAKKTDDGQTYYLVPGTDSIALVNQHGVGSIDDMDHALSGQNVGIQDCADGKIRLLGILPDEASGARAVLADGSVAPLDATDNVYVHLFERTAATLPRTVEFELAGVTQQVAVPLPDDILEGHCPPA